MNTLIALDGRYTLRYSPADWNPAICAIRDHQAAGILDAMTAYRLRVQVGTLRAWGLTNTIVPAEGGAA